MEENKTDNMGGIKEVIVSSNLKEIEGNKNIVLYLEEMDIKGVAVEPTRYFGLIENTWIVGRLPGDDEEAKEEIRKKIKEVNFKIQTIDMAMSRAHAILTVKKQINGEYALFISSRPDFSKRNAGIIEKKMEDKIVSEAEEDNPLELYEKMSATETNNNNKMVVYGLEDNPFQLYEGDEFLLGNTRFSVHFLKYKD